MIAAVCTSYNEADIIATCLANLLNQGVDHIYLADASTDDTRREAGRVCGDQLTIVDDDENYHFQPQWINRLASMAADAGHEWIIPFDADEIWYPEDADSILEALESTDARNLHVRAYQHRDWDHRETEYRSMGKCAFRWEPGCWVANGNHSVLLPNGGPAVEGVLALRELQFRSFEHLARKCRERVDRLDPALPWSEGTHQRVLAALSEDELRSEWARLQAVPVVWDPIPAKGL